MNERLSRLERHTRKRSLVKRSRGARKGMLRIETAETDTPGPGTSEMLNHEVAESPDKNSFSVDHVMQPLKIAPEDSVIEKLPDTLEVDLSELPTRRELFPSHRIKITRWFYNSLLFIFIAITVYLLWWGISDSPWGQSHGL